MYTVYHCVCVHFLQVSTLQDEVVQVLDLRAAVMKDPITGEMTLGIMMAT